MDVLHGKTVPGVLQDLTVWAMVDNPGRLGMGHAARLQPSEVARLSSVDALRWLSAPSPGLP
jgi:hypothetical protein